MRRTLCTLLPIVMLMSGTARMATPAATVAASTAESVVVDAFDDVDSWSAHPADGVELAISRDTGVEGDALRLDFSFTGGGYAIARKELSLDLPQNYAFSFQLRGEAPSNHLEFKLVDETGENVW